MSNFSRKLVLFSVLYTSLSLTWTFPLPQEDENGNETPANEEEIVEEEDEEEGDEEYEEVIDRGTTIRPGIYSTGDEEVDNYLKRNFDVKQIVSEKLAITNFTRQSLYEQGANALFSYIADRTVDQIPTEPPTPPPKVVYRTRRYKVRQTASTLRNPFKKEEEDGIKKTFEITVPDDLTKNAEGTIEITIPQHLTKETELNIVKPDPWTLLSQSTHQDVEGVKSIEDAIKQALLMGKQKTGFDLSTLTRDEETTPKINELDIAESTTIANGKIQNELNSILNSVKSSEITTLKTELLDSTQNSKPEIDTSEPEVESKGTPEVFIVDLQTTPEPQYVEYVEYIEEQLVVRTRKPTRVRSTLPTTTKPSLNPIKALFAKGPSQTPGVTGFVFDSLINSTKNSARIAAGAVWCAIFDHCPEELEREAEKIGL